MEDIEIPDDALPVLACLPADPATWDRAGFVHINVPKSYIKDTCATCGCEVYKGPVQQEFQAKHPKTIIQCFECTIKILSTGKTAGVKALSSGESCQMFTKKGKIFSQTNPNN